MKLKEAYMEEYEILPAGDQAMVVDFGDLIDEKINDKAVSLSKRIKEKNITGITEVFSTYRSVMIFYDKSCTNFYRLRKIVKKLIITNDNTHEETGRKLLIPCCYEDEYGLDLGDMEKILSMSKEEIIRIHSEVDYKVFMLGFLPGFVYLGGLDKRIHTKRLDTPRTKIPERSVGIGGNQTGVYPMESPGGWRLIGKTPLEFYNPQNENPILCRAGDIIRFCEITSDEYRAIRNDVKNNRYTLETV